MTSSNFERLRSRTNPNLLSSFSGNSKPKGAKFTPMTDGYALQLENGDRVLDNDNFDGGHTKSYIGPNGEFRGFERFNPDGQIDSFVSNPQGQGQAEPGKLNIPSGLPNNNITKPAKNNFKPAKGSSTSGTNKFAGSGQKQKSGKPQSKGRLPQNHFSGNGNKGFDLRA